MLFIFRVKHVFQLPFFNGQLGYFFRLMLYCGLLIYGQSSSAENTSTSPSFIPDAPKFVLTNAERAWLTAHPDIVLGMSDQFPPALIRSTDGTQSGLIVDYFELINRYLNTKIRLDVEPSLQNLGERAISHEIDGLAAAATATPYWDSALKLTNVYLKTYYYFYIRHDDTLTKTALTDLAGKRIGIIKGNQHIRFILQQYPAIQVSEFDDNLTLVAALIDNKVDLLLSENTLEWWRKINTSLAFKIGGLLEGKHKDISIAIRKDWPDLVIILNKALAAITPEEHAQIRNRWLGNTEFNDASPKVVLTAAERAWITAHPDIVLGTDRKWAPNVQLTQKGIVGIEPDLLARINTLTGAHIRLELGDWSDMVIRAEQGDLYGLAISVAHPERAATFLFTSSLYGAVRYIFTRRDQTSVLRNMNDLIGKKVGLLRGNLADKKILEKWPGIIVVESNYQELIGELLNDKIDAIISGLAMLPALRKQLIPNIQATFPIPNSDIDLCYSIRREYPELHSIINKAMAVISPQEMQDILSRWMSPNVTEQAINLNADERIWLTNHPVIRYAINPDWAPIQYSGRDGQPNGISPDYLEHITALLGI
ncbi:transporter substrate-binding domain-containing protein, partial [Chromatium okenii]|uniref:transporter substrate-binding domain-containing protein n=1 Tax=Chromatium okenii TaxID=61644 RepID=UPI0034E97B31|nr:transporter substrate-binding domain-containing protein [Chromatium okenii]